MSYVGTKVFIGICVNILASVAIMNSQSIWLNKRLIEDRNLIIEEIKKAAAK
jgi:hypothetical protein